MNTLILIGMVLVPSLVFAGTLCKVTEFPEYYEVVCTGDEKAVPAPDSSPRAPVSSPAANQTFVITPAPPQSTATSEYSLQSTSATNQTMIIPKNSLADDTTQKNLTTQVPSSTAPGTIVHRQGRQQYNKALQDAIAARLKMLSQ